MIRVVAVLSSTINNGVGPVRILDSVVVVSIVVVVRHGAHVEVLGGSPSNPVGIFFLLHVFLLRWRWRYHLLLVVLVDTRVIVIVVVDVTVQSIKGMHFNVVGCRLSAVLLVGTLSRRQRRRRVADVDLLPAPVDVAGGLAHDLREESLALVLLLLALALSAVRRPHGLHGLVELRVARLVLVQLLLEVPQTLLHGLELARLLRHGVLVHVQLLRHLGPGLPRKDALELHVQLLLLLDEPGLDLDLLVLLDELRLQLPHALVLLVRRGLRPRHVAPAVHVAGVLALVDEHPHAELRAVQVLRGTVQHRPHLRESCRHGLDGGELGVEQTPLLFKLRELNHA
eukprot:PhM_4_TR16074/c0_g1_i1/m.94363